VAELLMRVNAGPVKSSTMCSKKLDCFNKAK